MLVPKQLLATGCYALHRSSMSIIQLSIMNFNILTWKPRDQIYTAIFKNRCVLAIY